MKALLSRILPIFITMIITGCNNDIFIDDEHPSITEIEIPDQGNKSITFQTSQLKSIEIAFYNDAISIVRCLITQATYITNTTTETTSISTKFQAVCPK